MIKLNQFSVATPMICLFALWFPGNLYAQQILRPFIAIGEGVEFNDSFYFAASDNQHGMELWVTDGTNEGTRLIKDISPGRDGSNPAHFFVFNDLLYFSADDGKHGREIWMTDGENASLFQDFNVQGNSDVREWIVHKNRLLVILGEGSSLNKLFEVDLIAKKLLCTHDCSKYVGNYPFVFDGDLYFFQSYGGILFKYDESGGEYIAMREVKKPENLYITNIYNMNDKILYVFGKNSVGVLKAKKDSIQIIKEFPVSLYDNIEMGSVGKADSLLVFSVRTDFNDWGRIDTDELWVSNGSTAGTKIIKSFTWNRHYSDSEMKDFVELDGRIYFAGNANQHALWVTDGTTEGTKVQKSLEVRKGSYYYPRMTRYGNKLYFQTSSDQLAIYEPAIDDLFILQSNLAELKFIGGSSDIFFFSSKINYQSALWMDKKQPLISISGFTDGKAVFKPIQKDSCSSKSFQIKNIGRETLFFSEVLLIGSPFFLEKGFPQTIHPGASFSFQVFFFPADSGFYEGSLIINSNDRSNPTVRIALEGTTTGKIKELNYACYDLISPDKAFVSFNQKKVRITNDRVLENNETGIVVGELFVEGNPANDFTFSLSIGGGDRDNSYFSINGKQLLLNKSLDFETDPLVTLMITATNGIESHSNYLLIKVVDENESSIEASCGYRNENLGSPLVDAAFINNISVVAVGGYNTIIKSDDGGSKWHSISPDHNDSYFRVLFPAQDTGYVCGEYSVLKTLDAGELWQALYVPLAQDEKIADIYFINGYSGFLLTSKGRLFKTLNGGLHWLFINKIEYDTSNFPTYMKYFNCMAFYDSQTGYIGASKGIIYKTSNGGLRWDQVSINGLQIADVNSIQLIGKDEAYIRLANNTIYKSTSGGRNWEPLATELSDIKAFYMMNSTEGFLFTTHSGIYKTINGGSSWALAYQKLGNVCQFAVSRNKEYITAIGQSEIWSYGSFGHKMIIAGRSNKWETISDLDPDDIMAIEWIDQKNGVCRVVRYDGYITFYKTSDGGITWKRILDKPLQWFESMTFPTPYTGIIQARDFEYKPMTYKTIDGGETWTILDNSLHLQFIYLFDEMNGYAGIFDQDGTGVKEIYKTVDGGTSWQFISKIAISRINKIYFFDQLDGYIAGIEYLSSTYYKTKDGGITWVKIVLPSFVSIQTLDRNNWYAKNYTGDIYKSTDGGITWSMVKKQSNVHNISPIYLDQSHAIGFAGSGLFETYDGGVSWDNFGYTYENVDNFSVNGSIYLSGRAGMLLKITTEHNTLLPGNIHGDTLVVSGETYEYAAMSIADARYNWNIQGGNIIRFNKNKILVQWDESYPGEYALTLNCYDKCNISHLVTVTVSLKEGRNFTKPIKPEEPNDPEEPEEPLSTRKDSKDEGYLIVPNPARDYAYVVCHDPTCSKLVGIEIYDMQGRLLSSNKHYMQNNSILLNLSSALNGLYILKINDGSTIVSKRILVVK